MRNLNTLPKAHLHLHFTGSLTFDTLSELAAEQGIRLPAALQTGMPVHVSADKRGWFRFQRLYDAARACVRSEATMRRVVDEAARNDASEGSVRVEIQIDPTSYAPFVGGITPALEIVLDEASLASARYGISVGVIVAASRVRHPLEARTLARLAARHADAGGGADGWGAVTSVSESNDANESAGISGQAGPSDAGRAGVSSGVIGFGLSNDERSGHTADFAPAFRLARDAGLASVPHGGELRGPAHVARILEFLDPQRIGHGVRATENAEVLARLVDAGVAFEVCPTSNVALGVYPTLADVPLPQLLAAGATVALGADDPLLFGSRLTAQYEIARTIHGLDDFALADLARASINASLASEAQKRHWLAGVNTWLATSD